ncbi:unnamed protein product, partial [Iphiclides podalirius]
MRPRRIPNAHCSKDRAIEYPSMRERIRPGLICGAVARQISEAGRIGTRGISPALRRTVLRTCPGYRYVDGVSNTARDYGPLMQSSTIATDD